MFNESIGAFQKRLELENAYKKLIYTNESISTIAYAVGFDSLKPFSKYFKKQFAHSPSDAQSEKASIFRDFIAGIAVEHQSIHHYIVFLRAQQDINKLYAAKNSADISYQIVKLPLTQNNVETAYQEESSSVLMFEIYTLMAE